MEKFIVNDLLKTLGEIMRTHTENYQSDFGFDKELLTDAAREAERSPLEDRTFLWLVRPNGTWCLRERNVFLRDSWEYQVWLYYGEQTRDKMLAYGVEVTGMERGTVMGKVYELNYRKHFEHVKEEALPAGWIRLVYEKGVRVQTSEKPVPIQEDPLLGELIYFQLLPEDPDQLASLLGKERWKRERMRTGDIQKHIDMLKTRSRKKNRSRKSA